MCTAQRVLTARPCTAADPLPWQGPQSAPPGLAAQLHSLGEAAVLRPLVRSLLPHSCAGPHAVVTAVQAPLGEAGSRVGDLCALLALVLQTEPLRPAALVALAASAELVPRLWFSYLKVGPRPPLQLRYQLPASCNAGYIPTAFWPECCGLMRP